MIDPKLAAAYLPTDRRRALARGEDLPTRADGIVLFADISGFTPLTLAYVEALGPTRGVEAATRQLNAVYDALVGQIHGRGGSIVGFSGDGMLCWFPTDADPTGTARAAYAAAMALHAAIAPFARVAVSAEVAVPVGLKAVVAAGSVRRLAVGDPTIQRIDVLAGQPVDAVGDGERLAVRGETLLEASMVARLGRDVSVEEWRVADTGFRFARVRGDVPPIATVALEEAELDTATVRPWLLPTLAARLAAGQEAFLAELRPTVALFLRFAGLDFLHDEAVGAKLDGFLNWAQQIIARLGGALIQVTTGDKGSYLYASFGATQMHADDAERAAAAGLALLAYRTVAPWLTEVRIGIAGGRTRVGPYGGVERCTFGAQGSAVNLAARLMMAAAPDTVVVEQTVADAVRAGFDVEALGLRELKGQAKPAALFRLIGRRDPGVELDPDGMAIALVGREPELQTLDAALDAARAGAGSWVTLAGPMGVGKSRLAAEIALRAHADGLSPGMRVLVMRGESTLRDVAYAALGHLLRSLFELPRSAAPNEALARLQTWVTRHTPDWLPRLALLRDVLDLPIPPTPLTAGLSASQRQDAVANLVADLVDYACHQQPILLIVEDSRYVDEASWTVMAAVARRAAMLPLLALVCMRTGDEPGRTDAPVSDTRTLDLEPLTAPAARALIRARLGKPVADLITQIVLRLTQGNSAYLLMLVDALVEVGHVTEQADGWVIAPAYFQTLREARALQYADGGWQLSPEATAQAGLPGLPDSMQGMLLAKIDRFGDDAKLTLKVASVVGRTFELAVVAGAHPAERDEARIAAQLATWLDQDVVRVTDALGPAHVTYEFRQAMLQEALYQTLLETQQQTLHGAVGWALETTLPTAVERLARHFAAADLAQAATRHAAVKYLDLAAAKSRRENANETARQFLAQLVDLAPTWTSYRGLVEVLHLLGRRDEEAAALATGRTLADVDPAYHAYLSSRYHEAVADYDDAWAAAELALRQAKTGGDIATFQVQMARIAGREGDYRKEEQGYRRALDALAEEPTPNVQTAIDVRYGLGTVYKQQGNYRGALDEMTVALELATSAGRAAEQARVLMAMGVVARMQRRFAQARAHTERALSLRREIGDRSGEGDSLFSLAQVVIHGMGDYAQGRDLLDEALGIQRTLGNVWGQAIVLNELGVVHYLIGLQTDAERILREVYDLCEEIGASAGLVYVQWNLGLVMREQGRPAAARDLLTAALHAAAALDDPHVTAQLQGELGLTELALGAAASARTHATAAVAALEELGLTVMTPADRATLAEAALQLGDRVDALAHARQIIVILDDCRGEGPDFPQREYRRGGDVLAACGEADAAAVAWANARRLLMVRAAAISDPALRAVFLAHGPGNAGIVVEPAFIAD